MAAHTAVVRLLAGALLAHHMSVNACGLTTHMTIAHRALEHTWSPQTYTEYAQLLAANRGAFIAGAPYPDYLYECGPDHNSGEYSHWAPFQANAATYLRMAYSRPWNASAGVLISFFHGIVSHYIADLNWHGMGNTASGYGQIESIGGVDFNCSGGGIVSSPCGDGSRAMGDAHTMADTGGEFIASYMGALDEWDNVSSWVIPVSDLVSIYAVANITVNASSINECAVIFTVGALAGRFIAWIVEPLEINASPTFSEEYVDNPCGGIDDMAAWSGHMWDRLELWFETGPPDVIPPNAHAHPRAAQRAMKRVYRALAPALLDAGIVTLHFDGRAMHVLPVVTQRDAAVAAMTQALRGVLTADALSLAHMRARADQVVGSSSRNGWTSPSEDDFDANSIATDVMLMLRSAGLAHALDALTASGAYSTPAQVLLALLEAAEDAHAMRAVRAAAVSGNSTVNMTLTSILASSMPLEYVGSSMAVGDFNGDGLVDVALGAYGHTSTAVDPAGAVITQGSAGSVYVQYGGIPVAPDTPLPLPDNAMFEGNTTARLGYAMCVLDFNADGVDDLAVSAPSYGVDGTWMNMTSEYSPVYLYYGRVHIYYGSRAAGARLPSVPSLTISSSHVFGFMGMHLSCSDVNEDGLTDLIIGSPFAQTALDTAAPYSAQRGRTDVVYASAAYQNTSTGAQLDIDAVSALSVNGSSVYERMGAHSAVLSNVSLPWQEYVASAGVDVTSVGVMKAIATCGLTVDPAPTASAGSLLLLGSPGYRAPLAAGGYAAVGRVSAYALPAPTSFAARVLDCVRGSARAASPPPLPAPLFTLTGIPALSPLIDTEHVVTPKFGVSFAIGYPLGAGQPYLAVGVPVTDGSAAAQMLSEATSAGAVLVMPLNVAALRGDYNWTRLVGMSRATLWSSAPDARCGMHVAFADATNDGVDDLVVACPMYSANFLMQTAANVSLRAFDDGQEVGSVLLFAGGPGFVSGNITSAQDAASAQAVGTVLAGRFGSSMLVADVNGDGTTEVVVGAPRATVLLPAGARRAQAGGTPESAGAVYVLKVSA